MRLGSRRVWRYHNPVEIHFGAGSWAQLPTLLRRRRYALVTYDEPIFAELVARCAATAGTPELVIKDVVPNPDCALLADQAARFRTLASPPNAIVAIGGGSVIDSAKVFAAAGGDFGRIMRFLESKQGGEQLAGTPIIAVPTTAGTGSEVTSWATVWDRRSARKYSLSHSLLYPEHAFVDPSLMVGKPRQLTISTGLDALSHALESLWNVNANPISAHHAVAAAREILVVLPALVSDLKNLELRSRMAAAALSAGLAFSNTRTAIAHSISYPVTLHRNVAHGIACSFTLPAVLRSVSDIGGPTRDALTQIFGTDLSTGAERLERFLEQLGVSTDFRTYGFDANTWATLVLDAFDGERGQNFLGTKRTLLRAAGLIDHEDIRGH
jgi:phosphonate metabolism-associated iron-containing alcohol dehydrogenase